MGWLMTPVSCWFLGTLLLVAPCPGASWYKHSASPRYHTVGRASGLLIGVRRSPYLWKRNAKVNPWAAIQQSEEENSGLLKTPWIGEGTGPQLSPDPGEKRLIQKLKQENRLRSLKAERNVNEVQDEKRLEEGSWLYNDLGEERSPEDQSQMSRNPEEKERRGLEENMEFSMEPGEGKRSPEETWITKEPREVVRSLEDGQRKVRNQDRHLRSSEEFAQERRPSGEDILSMFLHLQEENRSYPQPWRTPTATDKQPVNSKPRTSEWIGCEDFRQISYKVLCRAALQFLSRSQLRPGRPMIETKNPDADLLTQTKKDSDIYFKAHMDFPSVSYDRPLLPAITNSSP